MDKAERAEAQDDDDEDDRHQSFIGHIFQLLTAILRQDGFIIGDMTQDISSSLWFLLLNWTLRLEPHLMVHLLRCQLELLRYIKLHWPTHRVARLISLPWNHLVLLHIVQSPMHSQCADLVRQLISQSNDSSGSCSFPGLGIVLGLMHTVKESRWIYIVRISLHYSNNSHLVGPTGTVFCSNGRFNRHHHCHCLCCRAGRVIIHSSLLSTLRFSLLNH